MDKLIYKTDKVVNGEHIFVTIELHEYFSITANVYRAGKPKTDHNFITGGCVHDYIAKHFPEFVPFIALHLADSKGVPMHALHNGFYHLNVGLNNIVPDSPYFSAAFCKYYRINPDFFPLLKESKNITQYGMKLQELGIAETWKRQADEAIMQLMELTSKA